MVGKIVSLAVSVIVMLLIMLFFLKKKSPALMVITALEWLALIATQVLTWVLGEDFTFATTVMSIVCVVSCVAVIVVYQSDIKNLFWRLSKLYKKNVEYHVTDEEMRACVSSIVTACQTLAKARTGALIVVVNDKIDQYILDSGVKLDALVSAPLLESIFNTKCPMHDGAVIVQGNRIVTAGSFLPLSKNESIAKDLGTRHRAGIGVTEQEGSDVTSIIISEENGIISTASGGVLRRYLTPERLFDILYDPFRANAEDAKKAKKGKNLFTTKEKTKRR